MKYAPWISLISYSTCCGCTVQYRNDGHCCRWTLGLALWRMGMKLKLPSVTCALFSCHWSSLFCSPIFLLDTEPPSPMVGSCSFPACWVDVATLHVSVADIFEAKDRPSCRSGASCKFAIQNVLGIHPSIHPACGRHGQASTGTFATAKLTYLLMLVFLPGPGHFCQEGSLAKWSPESSRDCTGGRCWVCTFGGHTGSRIRCHRAVC